MSPSDLLRMALGSPLLMLSLALVVSTMIVNGATDAANSIAEAVGTRSLGYGRAVLLAAACEFLGLVGATLAGGAVAETMSGMVDFGGDPHAALVALCAAMVAIVTWAGAAWALGIPTSESHALIAGLSGAAIAVSGGPEGIVASAWSRVVVGLFLSTGLGLALGWVLTGAIRWLFADADRRKVDPLFGRVQVLGAAVSSLMHGAQDGQKFMATAMMCVSLAAAAGGGEAIDAAAPPTWMMFGCAALMATGTAIGGKRIVQTVGEGVVPMERYQGAAASLSAGVSLFLSTVLGLPVSTTHAKTSAIVGTGMATNGRSIDWSVAKEMVLAWVLTFPGCGAIGYALAWLLLRVL